MSPEELTANLLTVLPYWHYKIERPFKQAHKSSMSLETYYALQMLRERGPITMSEFAHFMKSTKQQATRTINALIDYKFVERLYDEHDRRIIKVRITDVAIRFMEENVCLHSEMTKSVKSNLSQEEVQRLNQAVKILLELLPKLD